MKNLIILTLALLLINAFTLEAQTEKGKMWIAGSSQLGLNQGGSKTKADGDVEDNSKFSYFELNFMPKIGFTVINNMPIGLFIYSDYYATKYKESENKYRTIEFAIGPFIRYYFTDLVGLKPYAEAMIGWGFYKDASKSSSADEWSKYKEGYFTYRIGGGATYYFNDFVGFDLFLGFNHESWTYKSDDSGGEEPEKTHYIYNAFMMQMGMVVMIKCRR